MNVLQILLADHKALKKMVNRVHKTSERAVKIRQELFEKIKQEATIHEKAEEKFLYPLVKSIQKVRPDVFEHHEEVRIMSRLLQELSKTDVSSEEWTAKFTVLKELTDHHIKEEEEEIFPRISRLLSKEDLMAAGDKVLKYKAANKRNTKQR